MDLFQTEIQSYIGDQFDGNFLCTVESVDKVVNKLKRGEVAGLDGLTSEHITNCHRIIITILVKLFNLMLMTGYVPFEFGFGVAVPIPKDRSTASCSDYRCISISPIISKIF